MFHSNIIFCTKFYVLKNDVTMHWREMVLGENCSDASTVFILFLTNKICARPIANAHAVYVHYSESKLSVLNLIALQKHVHVQLLQITQTV